MAEKQRDWRTWSLSQGWKNIAWMNIIRLLCQVGSKAHSKTHSVFLVGAVGQIADSLPIIYWPCRWSLMEMRDADAGPVSAAITCKTKGRRPDKLSLLVSVLPCSWCPCLAPCGTQWLLTGSWLVSDWPLTCSFEGSYIGCINEGCIERCMVWRGVLRGW